MALGNNQYTNPWTEEEILIIKNKRDDGVSWKAFAKDNLPNRTCGAVKGMALKLGLINQKAKANSNKKYSLNASAWGKLTPESCYFGGIMATDGCFIKYGKIDEAYSLRLDVHEQDTDLLEKFKKFCGFDGQTFQSSKVKKTKLVSINSCGCWKEDLFNNFSITERKTFTLNPPNIDNTFLSYCFLKGAVDGDGCITIGRGKPGERKQIRLSLISASEPFAAWVYEKFEEIVNNGPLYKNRSRRLKQCRRGFFHTTLSGLSACVAIDFLRQLPVSGLNRKWNKPEVLEYIELQKQKYPDKFLTLEIPAEFRP